MTSSQDTIRRGSVGTSERAAELYALGLPTPLILAETGMTDGAFRWAMQKARVRRPTPEERRTILRELRCNRIRANVLESPCVSMFDWHAAEAAA